MPYQLELLDRCIEESEGFLRTFLRLTQEAEYYPGGVLPSEMLAFASLSSGMMQHKAVESGRKHGFSTEVLARCGYEVHSYEIDPISSADDRLSRLKDVDLRLYRSDFSESGVRVIKEHKSPVLIDGPKGRKAVRIAQECLAHVPFIAIHDMSEKQEGGSPNPGRVALEQSGMDYCIIEGKFVERFGLLDRSAWKNDYSSREELTRYGSHLAIIKGELWS